MISRVVFIICILVFNSIADEKERYKIQSEQEKSIKVSEFDRASEKIQGSDIYGLIFMVGIESLTGNYIQSDKKFNKDFKYLEEFDRAMKQKQ